MKFDFSRIGYPIADAACSVSMHLRLHFQPFISKTRLVDVSNPFKTEGLVREERSTIPVARHAS